MGNSTALPDRRIFMTGVINSGTTTLMQSLGVPIVDNIPTIGFNLPQLELNLEGKKILLSKTNIGGCDKITGLFQHYGNTDASTRTTIGAAGDKTLIICVVDSIMPLDHQRAELDKYFLMNGEAFSGCPILFIANKQDMDGAASVEDTIQGMALNGLADRKWLVVPCVATNASESKAVMLNGVSWLLKAADGEQQ